MNYSDRLHDGISMKLLANSHDGVSMKSDIAVVLYSTSNNQSTSKC